VRVATLESVPDQSDPFPTCAVCGRTILKGEQVYEYVNPHDQRVGVCVLCRSRAEASGWIPADQAGATRQAPPSRARPGDALRKRLAGAASRARSSARGLRGNPATMEAGPREPERLETSATPPRAQPAQRPQRPAAEPPAKRQRPQAKRQPKPQPAAPAAPRKPRPRRGPQALMRRAVQRFNESDEPRKVAGLIRSLGEPRAAVRADASRQLALVTVAWELSWYQWEVSADGDGAPVREVAKGDEVSELAEDARAWNAAVAEDGQLRLKSTSARRKPSAKEA
jgi:hypothetical protein